SSTVSSESAPKSSTKEAFDVTSPSSTPSCSTMICFTLSSTAAIRSPRAILIQYRNSPPAANPESRRGGSRCRVKPQPVPTCSLLHACRRSRWHPARCESSRHLHPESRPQSLPPGQCPVHLGP